MKEPTAPGPVQDIQPATPVRPIDELARLRATASEGSLSRPHNRFSLKKRFLLPLAGVGIALLGLGAARAADSTSDPHVEVAAAPARENLNYDTLFDLNKPWEWSSIAKGNFVEIDDPLHPGARANQFILVNPKERPIDPRRRAEISGPTSSAEPMVWQGIDVPRLTADKGDILILPRIVTSGLPSSYASAFRINNGGDGPSGKDIILRTEADKAGKFGRVRLQYSVGGVQNRDNYLIDEVILQAASEGENSPVTRFRGGLALTEGGTKVVVAPPTGFLGEPIPLPESFYKSDDKLAVFVGAGPHTYAGVDQLLVVKSKSN